MDEDRWSECMLGPDAEQIKRRIAIGVRAAWTEGISAQAAQVSKAQDTFGHTLKVAKHEQINAVLEGFPGVELRTVQGVTSRFQVPVIVETNVAIIPIRARQEDAGRSHKQCRVKPSELLQILLEPVVTVVEPDLFTIDTEAHEEFGAPALDLMSMVESRAVIVWINATAGGIFEAGVGVAKLIPGKSALLDLDWSEWEDLPLKKSPEDLVVSGPVLVRDPAPVERFDDGDDDEGFGLGLREQRVEFPESEAPGSAETDGEEALK